MNYKNKKALKKNFKKLKAEFVKEIGVELGEIEFVGDGFVAKLK